MSFALLKARFRAVFGRKEISLLHSDSDMSSPSAIVHQDSAQDTSGSFSVLLNNDAVNQSMMFPSNFIKTSRYNVFTFLPLNLYQQFHRFANCYFLACIFIQIIPNVSPFPIYTTIIPLVVILAVSAIKDGIEDWQRHRQDEQANNRRFEVVRNFKATSDYVRAAKAASKRSIHQSQNGKSRSRSGSHSLEMTNVTNGALSNGPQRAKSSKQLNDESLGWLASISSRDIQVGQILKVKKGEEFPADLVLLSTSNVDSTAFVNTANLDGEAVPKVRVAPQCTLHANTPQKLLMLSGRVKAEAANANLYQFQGRIELDQESAPMSPKAESQLQEAGIIQRGPAQSEVRYNDEGEEMIVEADTSAPPVARAANVDRSGRMLFPVGDQQLCLRGSRLVNTEWMYGLVVYTGYQTKMMLNRNAPRIKDSYFEHKLNQFVVAVFVFNFFVCLILSIVFAARDQSWASVYHLDYPGGVGWLLNFLTQYILLSFMIPISLYVTIELVRVGQVLFMQWDKRMLYRDPVSQEWRECQVKSSSLNEELGCLEYVFSDKTGTLTQNKMELSAMSVDGNIYFERSAAEIALEEQQQDEGSPTAEAALKKSTSFEDDGAGKHAMVSDVVSIAMKKAHQREEKSSGDDDDGSQNIEREFFVNILTCNSVMPAKKILKPKPKQTKEEAKHTETVVPEEEDDPTPEEFEAAAAKGKLRWQFQSQSPDEIALCETCHRYGLTMAGRKGNTVTVDYNPRPGVNVPARSDTYTIMATLDFTSTRARMCVVLRTPDDQYRLYIKGADSAVYKRLEKEATVNDPTTGEATNLQGVTAKHVETFAGSGSRTLCYAYRPLTRQEFQSWEKTYQQAVNALEDRETLVEMAFEEIEHSMRLLGCTGVEDQLQEYVPEAIDYMIKAGLKVVVLTGDKKETAVTIARQSNLVPQHFDLFYMQGITRDAARESLDAALKDMHRVHNEEIANGIEKPFALAIDGLCMELCLTHFRQDFITMFTACRTIVSYRSTPRQKALCVGMAKVDLDCSVCAIGDGANDVSMIQEAKVGVGILGKEGAHAAMSADYVIHRFYHLIPLIMIHGRFNLFRTAKVCYYSFYKNMLYSFPQIYYSFYSLNSGQTLYIAVFQSTFNLLFTSLPPLFAGLYERDLPDDLVLNHPETFELFKRETIFDFKNFVMWILSAIYHGTVLYFFMHFALLGSFDASGEISQDGRPVYLWLMGTIILFAIVLLTNLKMVTSLDYITWISVASAVIGVFFFFMVMILFGAEFFYSFSAECFQILNHFFGTNLTWMYTGLVLGMAYIPTLLTYVVRSLYFPTNAQKLKVWYYSQGGREQDMKNKSVFCE